MSRKVTVDFVCNIAPMLPDGKLHGRFVACLRITNPLIVCTGFEERKERMLPAFGLLRMPGRASTQNSGS